MKFVLGILLLFFSTIIGYFLASKYIDRKKFYNDFINFNQLLKQQILFNKRTLIEIIKEQKNDSEFYLVLQNGIINKRYDANFNYLNKDDVVFFSSYLKSLGTSDIDTQIDFINKTNEILVVKFNQALEYEKKYKTLYIKMGFLIGLMLMIIVL